MTKKELIEFLEPFSEDIQIVIYNEKHSYKNEGLADIHPKYRTAKNSTRISPELGIYLNDGYVVII